MDYEDEQKQELEVLSSIYPDELTIISKKTFTIRIALDTQTDRGHVLVLGVKFPDQYPEVVPCLDIEWLPQYKEIEGNTDEEDNDDDEKFVSLSESINFEKEDLATLLARLDEEAELNIGMPSIFTIAAILKDEAELLFLRKVDAAQITYDKELLAREAEEQKKFHGTKVNKDLFEQWRKQFREEMKINEKNQELFEKMHNGKMTGREIFEKGLAGDVDDDLAELTELTAKIEV